MGSFCDVLDHQGGRDVLITMFRQRGGSIIEPMIALAIFGILLALAVPLAQEFLYNQRIRTAAETLQSGLQMARMEAVRRNEDVAFVLGVGTAWSLVRARDNSVIHARSSEQGTGNVLLARTPASATTVTFDGLGRRGAANADGSNVLTRIDVDLDPAVLAPDRTRDLRVDIGLGGQVRMCDPNVSDHLDSRYCS
jgi:type IV fimbrial biogenesis protein FimT